MENKFTPEHVVRNAEKTVMEATPIAVNLVVALGVPMLRAFTWGLDEVVAANTKSHAARMVTQYLRAQTHTREVSHT